jgi:hypothetical protein
MGRKYDQGGETHALGPLVCVLRARSGPPRPDEVIAALAAGQHGVVTRRQLRELGLSDDAITRRLAGQRLLPLHAGVYAPGHVQLATEGKWLAAVLACGPHAGLSHRAGAALHGLRAVWRDFLEVSAPRSVKGPKGVLLHRSRSIERTVVRGFPATTVARTIVDLADVVGDRALRAVLEQAEILRLDVRIDPIPGRRGHGRLLRALAEHGPFVVRTRSDLEIDFLELCRRAGLPAPDVNTCIEGMEVDFAWPAYRLAVEADGWGTHGTRTAFQRDRRRGVALAVAGWTLLRFTYDDVVRDPAYVTGTLGRFVCA